MSLKQGNQVWPDCPSLLRDASVPPERLEKPSAWSGHIPFATWLVGLLKPRTMVELGVHYGTSYFNFCRAVQVHGTGTDCFGVDLWHGDEHAGWYGEEVFADVEQYNREHFSDFSRLLRMTFDEASTHFSDGQIDLLHIDGLHTYDEVKHDFETWAPKLSPTAVVLFHDTNVFDGDFGVWRLWLELEQRYPRHLEFKHSHGLGVIQLNTPPGDDALHWLCADSPQREPIIAYLTTRGQEVLWRYGTIQAHRGLAEEWEAARRAKDAEIADLQQALLARDDELGAAREALREQERALEEWEAARRAKDAEIVDMQQALLARDDELGAAREALREERALNAARKTCAGNAGDVAAAQAMLSESVGEVATLKRKLDETTRIAHERDAILASTSWRITRPLRAVIGVLRRDPAYLRRLVDRLAMTEEPASPVCGALDEPRPPVMSNQQDLASFGGAESRRPASLLQLIEEQRSEIERLRADLSAVYRSSSWRVTGPLRLLGQLTKDARDRIRGRPSHRAPHPHSAAKRASSAGRSDLGESTRPALPGLGASAIVQTAPGRYAFSEATPTYRYLEPRQPRDLARRLSELSVSPLFSIVVPVYNTPPHFLASAVESVLRQWYPRWQLLLIDDASPEPATIAALQQIDDPRISVVRLAANQGISGATNRGLEAATGDWIVFMDHDDELTPDCLYELALCLAQHEPDFIYSDEDKISEEGVFTEPHFKPDWSPDTMMSTMFTGHVSAVRTSLLHQVGPLRSEVDGCQDWDLVLRIAEATSRIAHVPRVLYHWRRIPGSIAADLAAKDYALSASRRVREDALSRRGLAGTVETVPDSPGYFRVNYHPRNDPLVSIIIPTRDNPETLTRCIDSIEGRTEGLRFEIVLIDNGSKSVDALACLDSLAQRDAIRLVRHDAPFNYSELNNLGSNAAHGSLLLFLNDDTEVLRGDWLARLAGFAQLDHVGAVGAKLLYPDTRNVQHVGVVNLASGPGHAFLGRRESDKGYFMRSVLDYNWVAVTGACMMLSREKFEAVGRFDEHFPIAYNDIELCFRLQEAGFWSVVVPAATLLHFESATRGHDGADAAKRQRLAKERRLLYSLHPKYFGYDPFFNPNLHPTGVNFELAL